MEKCRLVELLSELGLSSVLSVSNLLHSRPECVRNVPGESVLQLNCFASFEEIFKPEARKARRSINYGPGRSEIEELLILNETEKPLVKVVITN